ncbi:ribosome hibernation-promoting factor, HPF/YfiA family [Microlunatus antarcticus]|uniref:Ribosome hibernation promoting factor n=1 Tax=Microlunatus antarcticus TaxID=53388 RepID=A0A7W5JX56_9ACTN|nr:ribosome-associated translation inhibitor RaiA [Microlunatus antarcticus]MBB3327716.1 ribosomal subunit interface protein [Microlunatus antarcticus]
MDVVVKSRHCSVADEFRALVEEKLARLEKLDDRVIRVEVEVTEEPNRRQHDQALCVEITLRSKGPVVRAEAASTDKVAAFDMALDRIMAQLRKAADRKKVHRGQHAPQSLRVATPPDLGAATPAASEDETDTRVVAGMQVQGDGPLVVREKTHAAGPMTLDQALLEMELVGHDFFLFVDAEHALPSVVYRRHGYDYGVIRLETTDSAAAAVAAVG